MNERPTYETQVMSFIDILPKRSVKKRHVLEALEDMGKASAQQVAMWLYFYHYTRSNHRSEAHSRLNELVKSNVVRVCKGEEIICSVSGKLVSVYEIRK